MLVYEAIADAPDSVDLFANGAKFFSQASDVVVYRTIEAIIAVTVLPLVYLINLFVNVILLKSGIQSKGIIIPYFIEVQGQFDLVMFARSFIGIPVGLALWFVTRSLLNGLALFSGEMARALLSPGEADVMMIQPDQIYGPPMSHVSGEKNY